MGFLSQCHIDVGRQAGVHQMLLHYGGLVDLCVICLLIIIIKDMSGTPSWMSPSPYEKALGIKVALGVIFEVFLYLRFYLRYCHEILHTYRCLPLQLSQ